MFSLLLVGCMERKTIHRNYKLAQNEKCDCLTRRPLIPVGKRSQYAIKETAYCTNTNYNTRKVAVDSLKAEKNELQDKFHEELITKDSLDFRSNEIDSLIKALKNEWTHVKIKTKWIPAYENNEQVILKQRLKYYNWFNKRRKYIGMKLFKNDLLVKSTLTNLKI